MKFLILPLASAILATACCLYGCRAAGMPPSDLLIVGLVAGSVAVSVAVSTALLAKSRRATR